MASVDEFFVDLFADPWYDQNVPLAGDKPPIIEPSRDYSTSSGGAGGDYGMTLDSLFGGADYSDMFSDPTWDSIDPSTWGVPSLDVLPISTSGYDITLDELGIEPTRYDEFDINDPSTYAVNWAPPSPYGDGTVPQPEKPGGITGLINSLIKRTGEGVGGLLENPLAQLLLWDKMSRDKRKDSNIPIGQEAYGGGGGQDNYFVKNLIPALMPGVAYGNVGGAPQETDLTPAEIGMRQGGIAGLSDKEGPGDVTLARLEPGEFVMTRKATQNIGVKNLYDMMRKAERMR